MKTAEEILTHIANENSYETWGEFMHDTHAIYLNEYAIEAMETYANQYKSLLEKYIHHVEQCEGVNFIEYLRSDIRFTEQEYEVLRSLAEKP